LLASDVRYADDHAQQVLDVYDTMEQPGGLPACVLFLHGGGFQILDKRSHWVFARELSRAGLVVFTANYRTAPSHPFPAACEDAARAYIWVRQHAARWGCDPKRIVVAGDSAGANLALGLCLSANHRFRPPADAAAWPVPCNSPAAALLFSGFLQVTRAQRFGGRAPMRRLAATRLDSISATYAAGHASHPLLDPLLAVEQGMSPGAPVFTSFGGRDPVADDSVRLDRALAHLGADHILDEAEASGHVFQTLYWQAAAQRTWARVRAFLQHRGLAPATRLDPAAIPP